MGVSGAVQTYSNIIDYGLRKVRLRFDRLFLQSFMAGVFIGMAGNACISLAGGLSTDPADPRSVSPVMQKFIFASIFPVAFIAIITTGAELFTGNTMTMLICLFERRVTFLQLLKNWSGSFLGNWLGTLFSAYFLTYLCCHFEKAPYIDYLNTIAEHKTSHGWGGCFLRGVGCNMWVCLAVWFVLACDDWSGKILALWFPIVCFVLSSYEHIIANLYTLQLCAMMGVRTSLATMIIFNLLPTFLGNLVGGCGFIGAVYFYNFHHDVQNDVSGGESHFEVAPLGPSRRGKGHELLKSCEEGGKGKYLGGPAGATTPHERSGFLLKDGIPSLQLPGGGAGGGGGFCPAGAATAAECSEQGSNNLNNEKDGGGAGDFSAANLDRGDGEHTQSHGYVSVGKSVNTTGESDVDRGRYANDAFAASAETWAGETSTNAGYACSSDNMAPSGREACGKAVLKPDAVHAAAVDLVGEQGTVDDLRRSSGFRCSVHSPAPRKEHGYGPDHVSSSSTAGPHSSLQLTGVACRPPSATSS